ncbi:MAG TPA: LytTR family DNA-binding domain-containing protein [Flavitalea sp.]|nr:LytTR family DNA-binding domain-containing protein [Flavitalea sp.]
MKVLIVEDEKPAAEKLQKALHKSNSGIDVQAVLSSIRETVAWLKEYPSPQLIFMDIHVSDGLSFKIFEQSKIQCPVVFVTAHDEYWQTSFEHNMIDYLLKPVRQEKLDAVLRKYKQLKEYFASDFTPFLQKREFNDAADGYKKRMLVKKGVDYYSIRTEEIAYFYAAHKVVCLVDKQAQKFILDRSLSDIEKEIDPRLFYRVNRKYLVNMNAIKRIKSFAKSKLLVEVAPEVNEEILISPENAGEFKSWLGN